MPIDTIGESSTTTREMTVVEHLRRLSRLDDLERRLTIALGTVEDLVRRRINAIVTRDDDS